MIRFPLNDRVLFNFFVVLPEVLAALSFGWIIHYFLHDDRLLAVAIGGVCLITAAGLTLFIQNKRDLGLEIQVIEQEQTSTMETTAGEQKLS